MVLALDLGPEAGLLMLDLKGRNVLVLGLGDTGLSLVRWLMRHGAGVRVADSRDEPPHAATLGREHPHIRLQCGPVDASTLQGADMIAVSPGVDRRISPIADAAKRGVPVVGDVELFARALEHAAVAVRVIAITGSNGKSTVTAMVGDMCRKAGLPAIVAGNIGLPVLDALTTVENGASMPDAFVLELSSFQLESTESLRPDAATVLNVCEDHMDRYHDLDEYAAAKARIFAGDGVQVLNRDDSRSRAMALPARRMLTFGPDAPRGDDEWGIDTHGATPALANGTRAILPVAELRIPGLHNAANALAALALGGAVGLAEPPLVAALREFRGLPHRVQRVAEIAGVTFYDDSKGTNVGATVAALTGLARSVVLIAGGDGKSQDFAPLLAPVATYARAVVLIGRDAETIARALAPSGVPLVRAGTLTEAVQAAYAASKPGEAVLLSPACASYDMFRNYVHRAEVFVAAVQDLAKRES